MSYFGPTDEERIKVLNLILQQENATEGEILAILKNAAVEHSKLLNNLPEHRNNVRREKIRSLEAEKQQLIDEAIENSVIFDVCDKFASKFAKKSFETAKYEMIRDESIDLKKVGGSVVVFFFFNNSAQTSKGNFEKIKDELEDVIGALDVEEYYDKFYTYLLHGKSVNRKSIIRMSKEEIKNLKKSSNEEIVVARCQIKTIDEEIEEIKKSFEDEGNQEETLKQLEKQFFENLQKQTNIERKLETYFGNTKKLCKLTGTPPSNLYWAIKNAVYGANPVSDQFFAGRFNSQHVEKIMKYVSRNKNENPEIQ